MGTVYMIPCVLHEEGLAAIPAYVLEAVRKCQCFFVENERTTRRYLKQLAKDIVIDDYEWVRIATDAKSAEAGKVSEIFRQRLTEGKTIGILSEAGCPGIADPGQGLAAIAQQLGVEVKPLTGPNSILLALMASGMNGQQFRFTGYLPIDTQQRIKAIKDLEADSQKNDCTEIFIETPYRNNQMIDTLLKNGKATTRLCIAVDLTGPGEWVKTKTIAEWQKVKTDIHKRPAIFLLYAG